MIGGVGPAANFCKQLPVGVPCSMAPDDLFRRYQEVGAEFVEAARARAEELLRQLAQMGDSTHRQAQDAVDDLVSGGRQGTGQILTSFRRELMAQLSQLGLATKDDLADLEGRLAGERAGAPGPGATGGAGDAGSRVSAPRSTPAGSPAPAAKKAAGTTRARKAPAKKAAGARVAAGEAAARSAPGEASPANKAPGEASPANKAPGEASPAKKAPGEV
jgi:polyhydroxyalkanoate synthesis regulator phasin